MERVLIIGSNGAGKSTFSYSLAEKLKAPVTHIDKVYWRGCWDVTPREEFEKLILQEAKKEKWIIEGNNLQSLPQRLQYADTVVWFEFPPIVCVINVLKREWKYYKKVRPDMPDECVSKLRLHFLREVWKYNREKHAKIENMLDDFEQIQIIRFRNYRQVKRFLNSL